MEKHKEFLRTEMHCRSPNWDKVEKGVALPFPDHRRLMNQKVGLVDVKAEYPALFNFKQVCACMSFKVLLMSFYSNIAFQQS